MDAIQSLVQVIEVRRHRPPLPFRQLSSPAWTASGQVRLRHGERRAEISDEAVVAVVVVVVIDGVRRSFTLAHGEGLERAAGRQRHEGEGSHREPGSERAFHGRQYPRPRKSGGSMVASAQRRPSIPEDEQQGHSVCGPGLPPGFDAKDPRWTSDDCIEPPQ